MNGDRTLEGEVNPSVEIIIPTDAVVIAIDPYALNIEDLRNIQPGETRLIRARRPVWGQGDLHRFIHVISRKNTDKTDQEKEN